MKKSFSFWIVGILMSLLFLQDIVVSAQTAQTGSTQTGTVQTGSTQSGSANSGSTQTGSESESKKPDPRFQEEISCFKILSDEVNADNRFRYGNGANENLSDVLVRDGIRVNISDYKEGFQKNLRKNPRGKESTFFARRNNVGTIIADRDYIATQFVTFGTESAFKFPLPTTDTKNPYGDDYGQFRDRLVYTHHLSSDGTFLSCAYLRIIPAAGNSLADVSPENYLTNALDESGFELVNEPKNPKTDEFWNRYIVGKINVPVLDYAKKPLMTISITTVAYDNKSDIFNEFETFPLQVRAMTDADVRDDVNVVQQQFLKNVTKETCLKIVHADKKSLPSKCGGDYRSLTTTPKKTSRVDEKNPITALLDWIIPDTHAKLDIDPEEYEIRGMQPGEIPQGIYVDEGMKFEHIQKLDAIGDPLLKAHVMRVVNPNAEKAIEVKYGSGMKFDDIDRAFLECNMDYRTRVDLISEWLDSVDVHMFDRNNITYPDPRIGDCLLPYPDVRHRDQIIPGSFLVNQYNAAVLTNNTGEIDRVAQDLKIGGYAPKYDIKNDGFSGIMQNVAMRNILGIVLLIAGIGLVVFLLRKRK